MPQTEHHLSCAALSIAGSDSCGGAGIQADLKTFQAFGVHGASAITAITAQNTVNVNQVQRSPASLLEAQIEACLLDLPIRAIKTGMLASAELIGTTAARLRSIATPIPLVVDPVMVATSGARLLDIDAEQQLMEHLLPLATLVTPNLPEAALMTGLTVDHAPQDLAANLIERGAQAVLIKGGHGREEQCVDWLIQPDQHRSFEWPRKAGQYHGTGCTFSAAITALLATGKTLTEAVDLAGHWLQQQISSAALPVQGQLHLLPFEPFDANVTQTAS